jgi:hypothetical protein
MTAYISKLQAISATLSATLLAAATLPAWAQEGFDETRVIIEINATDGDVGFHAFLDADAWQSVKVNDPRGRKIFSERATGDLRRQGLTENSFESDEPLCAPDEEDPEAEFVPLAQFLRRFPAGDYVFTGRTIEGDPMRGSATLTYDLPAAADISAFDGTDDVDPANAVISWTAGTDLGEKCQDDDLVADGTITDPALVEVVGWEVVVEPADEEAVVPLRVFTVQLPPGATSVAVSPDYLTSFPAGTEFKFEVGSISETGNQTFSEGNFCTLPGCPDDE